MDLNFKRQIDERMQELPPALASAIQNSGWEKAVFDIGRSYNLHVDDIGQIQNELILVLTGIVHPDEFKKVLIDEIGISSEKTEKIIDQINIKVNSRIKDALRKEIEETHPKAGQSVSSDTLEDHEIKTMKKAGVSLGDDEDDALEETSSDTTPDQKESEEEVEISLPPINEEVKHKEVENKPPMAVVDSKTDPYREPIE